MKITFGKIVIDSPADSWEGAIRWIPIYADGKELHVYLQSQGVKTWEVSAEFWDDKEMPYDPEIELYYDVPLAPTEEGGAQTSEASKNFRARKRR